MDLTEFTVSADYSTRRASIGSIRVARRAGTEQVNTATATSTRGAATNVRRSSVATPHRKDDSPY